MMQFKIEPQLKLEPLYGSVWVVILVAVAVVAVISIVVPPTDDPRRRKWLIGLRSAAALVLLLAAMRPTLVRTDQLPSAATLVVAYDASKSMSLPDGDGGDRWSTQVEVLKELLVKVSQLDDRLDVHLLRYQGDSQLVGQGADEQSIRGLVKTIRSEEPLGSETNLGVALRDSIDSAGGRPLAGVVLIGDGTQTSTSSIDGGNEVAARRGAEILDALGVPLWTVPIGPPGANASARDVAVLNLPESFQLFAGNQFEAGFTIQVAGLANQQLPVQLSWIDAQGKRTDAVSRQVDSTGANESLPMNLTLQAPDPGLYRLQVSVKPQVGEWITSNNAQTSFVEVREGGGQILILEGPGRPEQTFLRRSLSGFPDLQISYAPIRSDRKWPVALDRVLQPGQIDIFMIGDLDSRAIGNKQLEKIAQRVDEGAGLIALGGFQSFGVGGYAEGPLNRVLPIKMDPARRRPPIRGAMTEAEREARRESQIAGPVKIELAEPHPVVNLGSADPASVWASLPKLTGANRLVGPKVATGVQVLLQSSDKDPLLVIGSYGRGRVAALAIDETFRWWRSGKDDVHRRFWRQLMLWLISREESDGDTVIAELDARRFESGQTPEFQARIQALDASPSGVKMSAFVVDAAGIETPLAVTELAGDRPRITGRIPQIDAGFYRLVVRSSDAAIQDDEVAFQVTETSREMSRPMADPVYLQQLADLTSAHGGAAFDSQQVDRLAETIASKRRKAETPVIEKQRLGDGPISGWMVFVLFAGCLSVEWFLRRRWGMV